jgi:acetate kinase
MSILVINAGSSSVKFALFGFDDLQPVARGLLDWAGNSRHASITLQPAEGVPICVQREVPDYRAGVVAALEMLSHSKLARDDEPIRVVGHRLIHGGEEIRGPVRIDETLKRTIARFAHLAPLHIPAGLEAIAATEAALPSVPLVGLFDTAFFADIPPAAYLYPVPYQWYEEWGIRRYGFHGTSHAYCTERAAEMLLRDVKDLRLVICHLGQGGSATAVRGGVAVTNTMGFTPLEGFMMGTRSGTIDPGILIHVQRERGLSVDQLDEILHHESGLLGISGVSSDFRKVEAAATAGHHRAQLALDVYAYRVRAMVGALAVTLGGMDVLVFAGGIGENSAWLRAEVCQGLECLGARLDPQRNVQCRPDADVAAPDSAARILVIHTREDLMIARQCRAMVLRDARAG